jgi:protoporphyrinogen oxidase
VTRICHGGGRVTRVVTTGPHGEESFAGTDFISSMPLRDLIYALDPSPPEAIRQAAHRLRYRDFVIVSLNIDRQDVIPDNWIYVHEPSVKVGRIQNFRNWSAAMVPDPTKTCLGMEYFVFENDGLWSSPGARLLDLARREIVELGLVRAGEIRDGTVVRMRKAYPMYDLGWAAQIKVLREYLESKLGNLQVVGRNGMHKYNNQDHSMMTALGAARNICGARHDLWVINADPEYQEEGAPQPAPASSQPSFPDPTRG